MVMSKWMIAEDFHFGGRVITLSENWESEELIQTLIDAGFLVDDYSIDEMLEMITITESANIIELFDDANNMELCSLKRIA